MLLYRYKNDRLKYSTGESIHPSQWDATTQLARTDQKNRKDREPYLVINAQLARYRSTLNRVLAQLSLADLAPTVEEVRLYLDKEFKKRPTKPENDQLKMVTFFEFAEQFLNDCKAGKQLTSANRRYSDAMVKSFRTMINHLIAFQQVYPKRIDFDAFTMVFYEKFKKHLTANNYSLNTIGNLIKNLKIILKRAHRDGITDNEIFRHEDFKKIQEEVETIYLNEEDLQKLYELDLSTKPRLDLIRDTFLIGCYTGLRFSDFIQLSPQNLIRELRGHILTVFTKKTGAKVSIPVSLKVMAILAKYDYQTPRVITNQKFNEYLKELAKLAGLTELVQTARTQGGVRVTRTLQKWELVTTHTARRSFATNAYKAGVSTIDIMKMTGHKTETSFMKYIKVSSEETAIRLLGHSFFSDSAIKVVR
ncbi:site-specific integrase [Spirosoma sp. SC4-14]|uniref:site-specific integrase n=1 Tax=Spirosoma sp. SC4-14 TaxID=3128900 RepID=UPI0030D59519